MGTASPGSRANRSPRTTTREPSSNGGVPKPSPVGRSPMRPVRAFRSGAMT